LSTILKFPDAVDGREQAAQWVVRLERGLSHDETEALRRWLAESRQHHAQLLDAAATWDKSAVLREIAPLFPRRVARQRFAAWRIPAAVAAAVAVTAVLFVAWSMRAPQSATPALSAAPVEVAGANVDRHAPAGEVAEFTTAFGQQRRIALADGSIVTLNTDSQLRVQLGTHSRDLELLRGEALFQVAKDPNRVFTVQVGNSQYKAVGTAFDLRLHPGRGVELTVTEGRVRVLVPVRESGLAGTGTEIMVDAGRTVTVSDRAQTIEPLRKAELAAATAWTRGMLQFDAVPLGEAIAEISRYSTLHFRIDSRQINELPVSGYFRIGDTEALVAALHNNFNIEARRDGNEIVLTAPAVQ
jgi:transmembrane sensor